MYLSRQPPQVCEIASQQAKAANYATLRSVSFFFSIYPAPQSKSCCKDLYLPLASPPV